MFVILTCGRSKARFVIARLAHEAKVIVDDAVPSLVNHVPSRFLPRFDSIEKARAALNQLAPVGATHARLVKR